MLKQQAQETGGFFKKQQQFFAEKVQKGFKMTSILASGQKKNTNLDGKAQMNDFSEVGSKQCNESVKGKADTRVNPAWIVVLEQMGFDASQVNEAAAMLGGQPEHMDELLQVLVTMNASTEPTTTEGSNPEKAANFEATSASLPSEHVQEKVESVDAPPLPPPISTPPSPPPLPTMSAVGSADYEMAVDRYRLLHTAPSAVPKPPAARQLSVDEFEGLRMMGFTPEAIYQATSFLDGNSNRDDLFDLLVAMGSPLSPPNSGGARSSTEPAPGAAFSQMSKPKLSAVPSSVEDEVNIINDVASTAATALVAEMVQHELGSIAQEDGSQSEGSLIQDSQSVSPSQSESAASAMENEQADEQTKAEEPSDRELASTIIASAVVRALTKLASHEEVVPKPKSLIDGPFTASPVRGGA